MFSKLHKRTRSEKGFTLIELLVVIIIIAILAAIAIPTFLGQRQKAQDSAAKSIVRNAMTAMESAYVDTRSFSDIDGTMLTDIEPSIGFNELAGCAANPASEADDGEVDFNAISDDIYEIGSVSLSDKEFGVVVNKTATASGDNGPGNTFYIDGEVADW